MKNYTFQAFSGYTISLPFFFLVNNEHCCDFIYFFFKRCEAYVDSADVVGSVRRGERLPIIRAV